MADFKKYKPGDKIYIRGTRENEPFELVVERVARKYAYLNRGYRINMETDKLESFDTVLSFWRSAEDYHRWVKRGALWAKIRIFCKDNWTIPAHLSCEDLELILDSLEGKKEGEE